MAKSTSDSWCVYVLKCRNNYLYIGMTNNIEKRLNAHSEGTGSKFVRTWRPFELVKVILCKDGREARSMEYRLKRLKRDEKLKILGIECGDVERNFELNPAMPDPGAIGNILHRGLNERIHKTI